MSATPPSPERQRTGGLGSDGRPQASRGAFSGGKTTVILAFFAASAIAVNDAVRAHIEACDHAPTLDRRITRAATAASAEEVIASADDRHE